MSNKTGIILKKRGAGASTLGGNKTQSNMTGVITTVQSFNVEEVCLNAGALSDFVMMLVMVSFQPPIGRPACPSESGSSCNDMIFVEVQCYCQKCHVSEQL